MFQPVELMNPEISLFERSTPLNYKNEKIKIKMEIPSIIQEERLQKQTQIQQSDKREGKNIWKQTMKEMQRL